MSGPATHPRFDEPTFTVAVSDRFAGALPDVEEQAPLPPLIEPEPAVLADPSDEPLVRVEHRRIRTLSNYWHAGWQHAIPGVWLRSAVLDALGQVAEGLPDRWGLAVFDGWRSIELQEELYEIAYAEPGVEPRFVTPASRDPSDPPPHVTGGTVDLGLTYDGTPLAPGAGFDDTTRRAHTAHCEAEPGLDRELRRFLYWSMRAEGFVVLDCEWWHFELGTRRWAAITGRPARYGPTAPPE